MQLPNPKECVKKRYFFETWLVCIEDMIFRKKFPNFHPSIAAAPEMVYNA